MIFAGHTTSLLPFQRQGSLWKMGTESLLEVSIDLGAGGTPSSLQLAPTSISSKCHLSLPLGTFPPLLSNPPLPCLLALASSVTGPPLTFWVSLSMQDMALSVHPPPDLERGVQGGTGS